MHVNIAALLATPEMKRHVVPALKTIQSHANGKFGAFLEENRLDLSTDLKQAAVCALNRERPPKMSVILQGNFKPDLLESIANKQEKQQNRVTIAGAHGFQNNQISLVQTTSGTIVAGTDSTLVRDSVGIPNGFGSIFRQIGTHGFAMIVSADYLHEQLAAQAQDSQANWDLVAGGTLTLSFDTQTSQFVFRIGARDAQAATRILGFVKAAQTKLSTREQKGVAALVAPAFINANVTRNGKDVMITSVATQQLREVFAATVAAFVQKWIQHKKSPNAA